jgi:hypothetical protein
MPLFKGWKLATPHPQKFLVTGVRARGGFNLVEALFTGPVLWVRARVVCWRPLYAHAPLFINGDLAGHWISV